MRPEHRPRRSVSAHHRWRASAMSILAAAVASSASATSRYWIPTSGSWNVAGNWNTDPSGSGTTGFPVNGDSAFAQYSDNLSRTITYVNPSFSGTYGLIWIDNLAAGQTTLFQSQDVLTAMAEYVSLGSGAGIHTMTGGTENVTTLILGYNTGSHGTMNLSGTAVLNVGTASATGVANIGLDGAAIFNQSGGTANVTGTLYMAAGTGKATYNFSGGTLNTTAPEFLGYQGTAQFFQTAGAHVALSTISLGSQLNSSGTYTLKGGSVAVNKLQVGAAGNGTFTQSGGTDTVGTTLYIVGGSGATSDGNGLYSLQGGTLNAPNTVAVGGTGINNASYVQSGGSATIGSLSLSPGAPNNTGDATLSGGSLFTSQEYVGLSGIGTFTQTGGAHTVNGLGVYVGYNPGSTGTFNLSGATSTFSYLSTSGALNVGYRAPGVMNQSGGTATATTVSLGALPGGSGTYTLNGSAALLSVTQQLIVGAVAASNSASAGQGVFNLSAGTITATTTSIGLSGNGVFNQTGGSHAPTALYLGQNSDGVGTYNLSGGALAATNEYVGYNGVGTFVQTGGSHTVSNGLYVEYNPAGGFGSYSLNGGTLTASVINNGTFAQTGGTLAGQFTNNGSLTLSGSPAFTATLLQGANGVLNISGLQALQAGLTNGGTVSIPATTALIVNNAPLDNEGGVIALSGGLLTGNGGQLNNGVISGYGTIGGNGTLTNNGLLNQGAGNLILNRIGGTLNYGTINLAAARQLQVSGTLSNAALINLNNGLLTGNGAIYNLNGGQIVGPGTILAPLYNLAGTVLVQNGPLNVSQPFNNAGLIQLSGLTASLLGGSLTNAGTIQGLGNVANNLTNAGTVEAIGGTLSLGGTVTNGPTGVLRVATGNKLLITGNPLENRGTINLNGGTLDVNNGPYANAGTIAGFGTLATGGLTNDVGGVISLTGGLATVSGPVVNAAGATIRVSYTPALFTHAVTNSGTIKITGTTVTFAAPFTNNGLLSSDPAVSHYTDLTVGETGALAGGAGDQFVVAGDFRSTSDERFTWDTATGAELKFSGGATHRMTLTSSDLGSTLSGYRDNFAWGIVTLAAGQILTLADGDAAPGGALYTTTLALTGAPTDTTLSAFIATHLVNADAADPMDVYYDATNPANAYLAGETYPLGNGGVLAAVTSTPEPSTAIALAALSVLTRRRRRPSHRT